MKLTLVGAGSLGLGLLYPWLSRLSDYQLSVITREGEKSAALRALRQYQLQAGAQATAEIFSCELFTYDPQDMDSSAAQGCVELLRASEVIAVSAGAGQLGKIGHLIARACLHRASPPLHVLAFENLPNSSRSLVTAIEGEVALLGGGASGREVIGHAAIPDRACARQLLEGSLRVSVERFGEILLEETARELFAEIPNPEFPFPAVRFISSAAVPLGERRKFWIVNGTHTALGLLCAELNFHLLNEGLSEASIARCLEDLHAEWVQVLHNQAVAEGQAIGVFTLESLTAHASRMFDRLRDLPDFSVRDVLRELHDLGDSVRISAALQRLLQKLDDRLADAVRAAGAEPVPVSGWMLASGLGTVRRYVDTYLM